MKRIIISILLLLTGLCVYAQDTDQKTAEIVEKGNSTDGEVVGQVIREDRSKDFNHWWLSVGGGFNLLLTERYGTVSDPAHNYTDNFNGAGYFNFGYMINPIWGVLLEYGYMQINKKIATVEGDFEASGHEVTLQLDFNILNLVRKCRKNTRWNVDALVGGGVLLYNNHYKIVDEETGEKKHYYYPAICIPVSLKIQYCPIDELGIALRMTGKWYSEDDLNYINRDAGGNNHNNDLGLYCGLELQYNITTPGKKHVRVTDRCTYEPMNVVLESKIADVNKNTEKIGVIEDEMDEVQQEIAVLNGTADDDVIAAHNARMATKKANPKAKTPAQTPAQTTGEGDGQKPNEDIAQNPAQAQGQTPSQGQAKTPAKTQGEGEGETPAKAAEPKQLRPAGDIYTPVIDPAKLNALQKEVDDLKKDVDGIKDDVNDLRREILKKNGTEENIVYFDFDKSFVKAEYELVIANVARNLMRDKSLRVELVSNCDQFGTETYNNELGKNRALAVYVILVNRYKIDKNRIEIRYDGQIMDDMDPLNRRCYFVYK